MFQEIKEIKAFREALKNIHPDTWVVLDLDNTVMTPRLELGGETWFSGLFNHVKQKGMEQEIAEPWILSLYHTAQQFVRTLAVEPDTIKIIQALQDIGIPVIGLTARDYSIRKQTMRQLADSGIDFSRNSVALDNGSTCAGGIIFCTGGDKGKHLEAFFSQQNHLPRHVSMLDDKVGHLNRVKAVLEKLNVNFNGFRYGYMDEQVKQFNMAMANLQLGHLWRWLPPDIQNAIKSLDLLPDDYQGSLDPLDYAHGFFHPDQPLQLHASLSSPPPRLPLERSLSATSFFYKPHEERDEAPFHGIRHKM